MSSVSNQLEKERAHTEKITRFQTYLFCFRIHISEQVEKPSKADSIQRFHPRHLVERRPAQKDTIIDTTSDSQVNSNFPYRWPSAGLTFDNYFYLFLYLPIYIFIYNENNHKLQHVTSKITKEPKLKSRLGTKKTRQKLNFPSTKKAVDTPYYSRTSVTRTLMACLPRLFRTRA